MTTAPTTARPRQFPAAELGVEIIERLPPHDLQAEAGVLGSMIIDRECIGGVLQFVESPSVFFKEENQIVFSVLCDLWEKNIPIDAMILNSTLVQRNQLETVGGLDYLKQLMSSVPTSAHAEYYAAIVKEAWMKRGLIHDCTITLRDVYESGETADVIFDKADNRRMTLMETKQRGKSLSTAEMIQEAFAEMEANVGKSCTGIETGFCELDAITRGLHKGEMVVVGARPSHGKSAFAMAPVPHIAIDQKIPVAVFSLEMKARDIGVRMLSAYSGVTRRKMESGIMTDHDRDFLNDAVGKISLAPIYIDDTPGMSIMEIRAKSRAMKKTKGIEVIIIDYLQLIESPREENRQQQVSAISRNLKRLASELDVPVIVLSQLNRQSESQERMPRSSDLRESGAVEQDADVIMLLYNWWVAHHDSEEWKNSNPDKRFEVDVIIAKQRNGPCNTIKLHFTPELTRFGTWNPGV